jgi:hypothetical protein
MNRRILISIVMAAVVNAAFLLPFGTVTQALEAMPAVSRISACLNLDTAEKRAAVAFSGATVLGIAFGSLTFIALTLATAIRERIVGAGRSLESHPSRHRQS